MDGDDRSGRPFAGEGIAWAAAAVGVTVGLVSVREQVDNAHVALAYLLVVLGASSRGGRFWGMTLALACFLAFNFFFLPPYHTLVVHNPLDWLVLLAFLAASGVAAQLLGRARAEAWAAEQRAREIDRLATLGAETLNVGRAEDAVVAIARVIQTGLDVAACEIYLNDDLAARTRRVARATRDQPGQTDRAAVDHPDARLLDRAAEGTAVARRSDGSAYVAGDADAPSLASVFLLGTDTRALFIPLRVVDRAVGVLRLENPDPIRMDAAQQRFAEALAYYAALALERVRLAAAAAHAEALREADRLKDALLASVSHDLRTPLTTIKALAHDIALDGDPRAATVEAEADRLNRFVSDLLDLGRLNAGATRPTPELVAAEDVLGAALQGVSGVLRGRTVHAAVDTAGPLLVGRLDFVHTLRALANLLENALKYSPADAAVDIAVHRDGGWLRFQVADRGAGVPPAERARIWEPFYRGAGTPDVGGTGLGLPIAMRSAELQGGRLEYAPRPGGGSIFTLSLPAADEAELAGMSA